MLSAGDLVTETDSIQKSLKTAKALDILSRSPHGVLLLFDGEQVAGLFTRSLALRAMSRDIDSAKVTLKDLALDSAASVSCNAPWPSFYKQLLYDEAVFVTDLQGQPLGVATLSTFTQKVAQCSADLERELDAVISCSSDEILIADGEGKILRVNSVFEENFGIEVAEVLGKKVTELEERKIFFPSVTRMVLEKRSVQTVIQAHHSGRKLLATATPSFNPDGSIFRIVVNTRDITRLNSLQQQLEEAELMKNRYYQELLELRQNHNLSGDILYSSPAMRKMMETARKIAQVDSTVLLTGESGVGKGVVARYLHNKSPRKDKPFITVNCGAIPENLLESELFGYVGGAFTGALKEGKAGKLELAHEGSLFLDEITELPLNLQVKLLHVIQEGIISRIGDIREIKLNLRFIAATNRAIEQEVAEGRFREDLFFRLNVIPLEIAPLRERREDIELLSVYFLEKFNRKYRKQKTFESRLFEYLTSYRWPGNVRELENLLERMVIIVDEEVISARHLPCYILDAGQKSAGESPPLWPLQPLKKACRDVEQDLLRQALKRCATTYEMARALGVDQSTVVRKLKKYNMRLSDE